MVNPVNVLTLGASGTRYGASLVITGWDTLQANLRTIAALYPQELGFALKEEGMAIMDDSQRVCPVDKENVHEDGSPHLVDTADVTGPIFEKDNVYVMLSYDTPYAVIQHETQDYQHDWPEQWKYLESPMMARAKFIGPNLVKAVDLERMGTGYSATRTAQLVGAVKVKSYSRVKAGRKQAAAFGMFNQWESEL